MLEDDSIYITPPVGEVELCVTRVSAERWAPGYEISRTSRPNFVLFLVSSGSGHYSGESGDATVRSGDVFTFAPNHPHRMVASTEMAVARVTAIGTAMAALYERYLGRQCDIWHPGNAHDIGELMQRIRASARNQGEYTVDLCNLYLRAILITIHQGLGRQKANASKSMRTWLAAKALIEQEYRNIRSISEVAESGGLSPEHLHRLFRRYGNETPLAYLQRLKLNRAASMLQDSDLRIQDIAVDVGYDDPFTFSKLFRRRFGVSPRAYRQAGAYHVLSAPRADSEDAKRAQR